MDLGTQFISALALGLALSIDSFAIAVGSVKTSRLGLSRELFFSRTAVMFALVQSILFLLGFLLGTSSLRFFKDIDHWITSLILFYLAYNV